MKIWTIHPKNLDDVLLVCLWRDASLGLASLSGRIGRLKNHPDLSKFRYEPNPVQVMEWYLWHVYLEGCVRGFKFSPRKIHRAANCNLMIVASGQLLWEFDHLKLKLQNRNPKRYKLIQIIDKPDPHPSFKCT